MSETQKAYPPERRTVEPVRMQRSPASLVPKERAKGFMVEVGG